jgi:hypothetical protein
MKRETVGPVRNAGLPSARSSLPVEERPETDPAVADHSYREADGGRTGAATVRACDGAPLPRTAPVRGEWPVPTKPRRLPQIHGPSTTRRDRILLLHPRKVELARGSRKSEKFREAALSAEDGPVGEVLVPSTPS